MSTSSELEWHCVSNMTYKKIKKKLVESKLGIQEFHRVIKQCFYAYMH